MLTLPESERRDVWDAVAEFAERYVSTIRERRVAWCGEVAEVREAVEAIPFDGGTAPAEAVRRAAELLATYHTHNAHPRHFGLFVPPPATMGIAADALVSIVNPAVGAWQLSPAATEIERRVVRETAARIGLHDGDGVFTTGGAEANLTALQLALARLPELARGGVRALRGEPSIYLSDAAHDSLVKAARISGLGDGAVRRFADADALRAMIERDDLPVMVVGTAGTTAAGELEPLDDLGAIARERGAWFHVDAAWGGAAMLVDELRPRFAGIERADSVSIDAHKWLAVPIGAGMLLTRHGALLDAAFRADASYVPHGGDDRIDYYARSVQWSRRLVALRLFLVLATAGWSGYAASIRRQVALGNLLRNRLALDGWEIVNRTPLPVVCVAAEPELARRVVESGEAWISACRVRGRAAVRACITSHDTTADDIEALAATMRRYR